MQQRDVTGRTRAEWERHLGAQIRRLRLRQGLDQAELAHRANVDRTTVSRIERGIGGNIGSLVDITRALGRSEWLDTLAPAEPSVSPLALLRARNAEDRPVRVRRARPS
jgi:transcriptional regulator with XRE-family HTH domain